MGAESDASWMIDKGGFEAGWARDQRHAARLRPSRHAARVRRRSRWSPHPPDGLGKKRRPLLRHPSSSLAQIGAGVFGYGYQTWVIGGKERQFALRGRRGQAIFIDPQSKLVLVHTAAGAEGSTGDLTALWFSVSKQFAK